MQKITYDSIDSHTFNVYADNWPVGVVQRAICTDAWDAFNINGNKVTAAPALSRESAALTLV